MSSRKELANAIRALSMDAVQKAKSGHPGAPMGMADIAEVLWRDFLKHNPQNPSWADRDRFVLSNGHGSMLIYSLLHLTGYDLPMEELKNFRQLHSKTPGHPEVGYTAGVETTTGPLGQGIANAVGMAIAEKTLAAQFNRPGHDIVDHYTYAFMGDGCMMEGISHEVCSLAGTLKLGKLIAFYDDNGISIDGHVEGWFTDDTAMRFEAYGWHVIRDIDGHDAASIKRAVEEARAVTDKPSLLMCKTIIGFGSPNKAGTHDSHGAPLGDAEIALTREQLGWKYAPFEIPSEIYAQWDAKEAGQAKESAWNEKFAAYAKAYPQEAAEFTRRMKGEMPSDFDAKAKEFIAKLQSNPAKIASRKASQNAIEAFGPLLPEFLGGSADLAPSNLTLWSGSKAINELADAAGTANQNLIIAGVPESEKAKIEKIAKESGLMNAVTPQRENSMACVSFPTCPLAMAEAERFLPSFIDNIDNLMAKHGVSDEHIVMRVTGCPNGCGRAMLAEVGLVGKAPGRYNLHLGGNRIGTRIPRMYKENITEPEILASLDELIGRWAKEREAGEGFGDFTVRAGIIRPVLDPARDLWD